MVDRKRTLETLEIIGGALCLDFANTINSRRQPEHDYLADYSDLLKWTVMVGVLPASQGGRLQKQSEQDDRNAREVLQKALSLRELLYQLFSKLARQSDPAPKELRALVERYAAAISQSSFRKVEDRYTVDWQLDATLDAVLWPIIYSAGMLLLSEKLARVKECPNCGWLFIDASKNQNRRWCSMSTCGARDKMRRYHQKLRE